MPGPNKVQRWDGSGPLCVGVELLILPELAIRHRQADQFDECLRLNYAADD
jgi:hypothetical protein